MFMQLICLMRTKKREAWRGPRLRERESVPQHPRQIFQVADTNASTMWSKVIQVLPPSEMKFLNAASDTLPHNANQAWQRGLSDACKLCGARQTLNHNILNHCKKALEFCRFDTRLNQVLGINYRLC